MKEKLLRVRENYMFSRTVYTQRVHTLYPRVFPEVQRSISAILFFFFFKRNTLRSYFQSFHWYWISNTNSDIEFSTRYFQPVPRKNILVTTIFFEFENFIRRSFFFFFSSMENIKILSTILCQLIFNIVIAARTSWRSWLARTTD